MSEDWQPIEFKPAWTACEERGIYSHDGDGLFYFRATHWRPIPCRGPVPACPSCKLPYKDGDTCPAIRGGCPMGGDF